MFEFTPEFFESVKKSANQSSIKFLNMAGIIPEVAEERHIVYRLPLNDVHLNHVGMMYAGSYFVFMESAGAALLSCTYGNKYIPILKDIFLDYLRPGKTDLVADLSMTAEEAAEKIKYIEEKGKGRYPMEVTVKDMNGEVCAVAKITYYLMKA